MLENTVGIKCDIKWCLFVFFVRAVSSSQDFTTTCLFRWSHHFTSSGGKFQNVNRGRARVLARHVFVTWSTSISASGLSFVVVASLLLLFVGRSFLAGRWFTLLRLLWVVVLLVNSPWHGPLFFQVWQCLWSQAGAVVQLLLGTALRIICDCTSALGWVGRKGGTWTLDFVWRCGRYCNKKQHNRLRPVLRTVHIGLALVGRILNYFNPPGSKATREVANFIKWKKHNLLSS